MNGLTREWSRRANEHGRARLSGKPLDRHRQLRSKFVPELVITKPNNCSFTHKEECVMSEQTLIEAAKAPIIAYNEKNWEAATRTMTAGLVYDEVATHRNLSGTVDVITAWKGWAAAFPDSKATFEAAYVSGNTVILEVTWRGTHTGVLRGAGGEIRPTGKKIEMRACQVVEVSDGKAQRIRQYFDMATMMAQLGVTAVGA
jgi:steroid delta-isomerase-like uncharacterized protein